MKHIAIIVGTRPNFIKITRLKKLLVQNGFDVKIIHTNQHFDAEMSTVFFDQFQIEIDEFIPPFSGGGVSGQLGHIMNGLEQIFLKKKPDLLLVAGDVNSTLAGSLVANIMKIKLGHIESGLRSFDRDMPEEINRILTDELTDYFFVSEPSGKLNLINEGKAEQRIFFVGNTMIDTLVHFKSGIEESNVLDELQLTEQSNYCLCTFHRPSNVDDAEKLKSLVEFLVELSKLHLVVFPVHPRTYRNLVKFGLYDFLVQNENIRLCESLDYFSFQKLISKSSFVLTDSGGIQEETTFLQIPCLTLRENTERPVTTDLGSNILVTSNFEMLLNKIRNREFKAGVIPEKWDGFASERLVEAVKTILIQ